MLLSVCNTNYLLLEDFVCLEKFQIVTHMQNTFVSIFTCGWKIFYRLRYFFLKNNTQHLELTVPEKKTKNFIAAGVCHQRGLLSY